MSFNPGAQPSNRPGDNRAEVKSATCHAAAYLVTVPLFVLLGSDGRMIYPHLPSDECGHPQRQVLAAMRANFVVPFLVSSYGYLIAARISQRPSPAPDGA